MQTEELCCQICKNIFPKQSLIHAKFLRPSLQKIAADLVSDFNLDSYICFNDLKIIRNKRIENSIDKLGVLNEKIKENVLNSIKQEQIVTENVDKALNENLSPGERASDLMAKFGGSWLFIAIFSGFILVWMLWNFHERLSFDPYPFIFLNLFLSCIAAFQAPIIMMSQNRQSDKDRRRDIADFQVNLKAELEILQLHQKLDLFFQEEWNKLLEIQKVQLEIGEEIIELTQELKIN